MQTPLSCRELEPLLETFADGELDTSGTVWVESHLAGCRDCVERLRFACSTKASLQRTLAREPSEVELPEGFLSRMESALREEESREEQERVALPRGRAWYRRWDGVLPALGVAAAFSLWIALQPDGDRRVEDVVALADESGEGQRTAGAKDAEPRIPVGARADVDPATNDQADQLGSSLQAEPDAVAGDLEPPRRSAPASSTSRAEIAKLAAADDSPELEPALDRLIDYHTSPPAPQVTEATMLPYFEPTVGVRLRLPSLGSAKWQGANLVPVVNHQAASLRYQMPGRRQVTVWVFDPRKVRVREPLNKHVVEGSPIYVGQWRGYSVAAKENSGIGYAMAADLDPNSLAELITTLH